MPDKSHTPLDLAGQITWIAWSLREIPDHAAAIDPIIKQALALGGIREFVNLRYRKAQGATVFGQIPNYPKADADRTAELLYAIKQYLAAQPPIVVPDDKNISLPSGDPIAAVDWDLGDVYYQVPLLRGFHSQND